MHAQSELREAAAGGRAGGWAVGRLGGRTVTGIFGRISFAFSSITAPITDSLFSYTTSASPCSARHKARACASHARTAPTAVLHDTVPCCAMLRCTARCRRLGEPHRGAERRPHDRHTGRTLHLPKYLRARQAQCELQEEQQVLFRLQALPRTYLALAYLCAVHFQLLDDSNLRGRTARHTLLLSANEGADACAPLPAYCPPPQPRRPTRLPLAAQPH